MSLTALQKISIILDYIEKYGGTLEIKSISKFWTVTVKNVGKDVIALRADKSFITALQLIREDLGINE